MALARFTPEMDALLAQMKGKTFKSFRGTKEERWQQICGNFRITLERFAVDVSCVQHPLDYFGELEDVSYFTCEEVDPKSEFSPHLLVTPKTYMVDEVITSVEVVNDYVNYNHGKYILDIDVALVIRTRYATRTFSRGIWFSEELTYCETDPDDPPGGIESVEQLWGDDPEWPELHAEVTRTTRVL